MQIYTAMPACPERYWWRRCDRFFLPTSAAAILSAKILSRNINSSLQQLYIDIKTWELSYCLPYRGLACHIGWRLSYWPEATGWYGSQILNMEGDIQIATFWYIYYLTSKNSKVYTDVFANHAYGHFTRS